MSEVNATGGVGETRATAKTQKAEVKPQQTKKNVPVGQNDNKKPELLKEPTHPKEKITNYTIKDGDQLGYVAERYHTTVAKIKEQNPGLDTDRIKPNQTIKIPYYDEKEMAAYNKKKDAYDKQQYEIKKARETKERIELANKKIAQAKKDGWGTDYDFNVNKDGYIIIKTKENKKLHEIRSDLGLPPGHLDDMNDLESKFGHIPTVSTDVRDIETWDNVKAKEGTELRISPGALRTERTWTQAFKDVWNAITGN